MTILIYVLSLLVIYCYLGYPFLIYLFSKYAAKPVYKSPIYPTVSVIISAYNEEDVIERKINNLLNMDYPFDKMEIRIASDGSHDRTNEIIKSFHDPRLHLTVHRQRQGKILTISELVGQSKSEIIVFNDARQILDKDAINRLVENFADDEVGCVSGELIFYAKEGGTAKGINLYWKYEKFIRFCEAQVHSMLGATGAIYAIRRELFVPGPSHIVLDDMYIPLKIIEQGYRAIWVDTAFAYDTVADTPKEEYRRKTRTLFGNYQIFLLFPGLFNPLKSPIAIQLFSHKFLRVILPFILIAIFVLTCVVSLQNLRFNQFLTLQIIFYSMAFIGALVCHSQDKVLKLISKVCYIPYVFCLLNFTALIGFFRFIESKQEVIWEKARD
jgi:biofilm PGA synthesis N-glycosyltransferase PgaC